MAMDDELRDLFRMAAQRGDHCRIVYRDRMGEHFAVMAVPRELRVVGGQEWGFFLSEAGEELEVRLDDMVTIEPQA